MKYMRINRGPTPDGAHFDKNLFANMKRNAQILIETIERVAGMCISR